MDNLISISFDEKELPEIFDAISKQSSFTIYYRLEDLPKNKFTKVFNDQKLSRLMDELLLDTELAYFGYDNYGIIIAPKNIVDQDYTAEYYKAMNLKNNLEIIKPGTSIEVGNVEDLSPSGKGLVRGTIIDKLNEETIIGATVVFPDLGLAEVTDIEGVFNLELPAGSHVMNIGYVGYENFSKSLIVKGNGDFTVSLNREAVTLQEILVKAEAININVESAQIGVERLDVKSIKKLPSFMGEADVIKSLLLQPGVSTVGEGAIGFNVRGGQVDQNLVMQDGGFLFNTSHALGFFSTFNPELISFVTLYKGNIPSEFGGRLASVLDVEMRDGSFRKYKATGGIGPISTKLSIEGPIKKEKTSFISGFRSSYSDWILNYINIPEVKRSSAFFYDFNGRLTHKFNAKNTLVLSGYSSEDRFSYNEQFGFDYQTQLGQLIYKTIISDKFFSRLTATYSNYNSNQLDFEGSDGSILESNLQYLKVKEKLSYILNDNIELSGGVSSIYYNVGPGKLAELGELSQIIPQNLDAEQALESALFIHADWRLNGAWSFSGGLRISSYQYLGPQKVFNYVNPDNPSSEEISGEKSYGFGEIIGSDLGLEPRFSMRYRMNPESSLKLGYSRTKQYINLLSNTNTPTPGAQWQLTTNYINSQKSNNFSIGYFRNFNENNWQTSLELYGRLIDDLFDFKDFASLTLNENIETELLYGIGRAYGAELAIKKKKGILNGSLGYTLSKSEKKIEGINKFNWYPNNFDKPHDLSLVLNFQPNQRNTFTLNFSYGSGRPTTAPIASYKEQNGFIIPIYSDRNQLRIPDFHRLDIAYTLGQSYLKNRKFRTSYTFSIYNVYGRENAFSVFFTQKPFQSVTANQLSIIGSAFPALTINFTSI